MQVSDSGEVTIYIKRDYIVDFFFLLKKSFFFKLNLLVDLTAVDFLRNKFRFLLFYTLLSVFYNVRVNFFFLFNDIIVFNRQNVIKDVLDSVTSVFSAANWAEREVWDMFGLFFINHVDLRRILTDYGFQGFPLRKDFPLTGFFEIRYDDFLKVIVTEKLKLSQEFRVFSFVNPWDTN